jgi:hypothetical protein
MPIIAPYNTLSALRPCSLAIKYHLLYFSFCVSLKGHTRKELKINIYYYIVNLAHHAATARRHELPQTPPETPQKSRKPIQTTPKNTPATMPQMLKIKIFPIIKHYKTTQYKITIKIIEK